MIAATSSSGGRARLDLEEGWKSGGATEIWAEREGDAGLFKGRMKATGLARLLHQAFKTPLLGGNPKAVLLEIYALVTLGKGVTGYGPGRLKAARLGRHAWCGLTSFYVCKQD